MRGWLLRRFHRDRHERELDDELRFHVETHTRDLIAQGVPPVEARRRALASFGGIEPIKMMTRDVGRGRWFPDLAQDLRYAARTLKRQPGFATVAVLTLTLGIGATTAIFSVVEAIFLRPLPVPHPEQLVLFTGDTFQGTHSSTPPPEGIWTLFSSDAYDFLRAEPLQFASVAAFTSGRDTVTARVVGDVNGRATPTGTRASAQLVSGSYFDVIGVRATQGRTLSPDDDRPEAPPVAVLSDAFWRNTLHAEQDVIGRVITLNRTAFAVVGVMPGSFFGERIRSAPDVWVSLARQPEIQLREPYRLRPDYYWLSLIGRLPPGRSRPGAEAAVTSALRRFLTGEAGRSINQETRTRIESVRVVMASGARGISAARQQDAQPLTLLLVAVGLLLVTACANVATLLLSRATTRTTEVAVRRALGAGRLRLIRQWLTESILLALMGAAGGLVLAVWLAPSLGAYFPSGPVRVQLNGPVLSFAVAITLLATVVFGLAPALRAGRIDGLAALRSSGRGTERRRRTLGATEPFVVAQIAVSLVLMFGAVLFARSLFNLEHEPLGFDQDRVLTARINPRLAGYTTSEVGSLYRRLYDSVAVLPGVEAATFARYSPFGGYQSSFGAAVEGYTAPAGARLRLETVQVGPNYPQTLGMPLIEGRAISFNDVAGAPLVAMVNEAFVRRFFPTSSPLGHHIQLSQTYEIVGVVRDALFHDARDQMIPFVFIAMLQERSQQALDCEMTVRARGDAAGLAPLVRQAITQADGRLSVTHASTLRAQVLETFGPERVAAGFVATFAGLALLLAAIGLYGVVSYSVTKRTNEIGVRLALGAGRADVIWLFGRETLTRLTVGLVIGFVLTQAARQLLATWLFGVTTRDLRSLIAAALALGIVVTLATLRPTLRALRVDPVTALRTE